MFGTNLGFNTLLLLSVAAAEKALIYRNEN